MQMVDTVKRTFRELSISQKMAMGAAIVVVLLAAAAFYRWVSTPSYTVLYSNIDQSQLSQVIDSLESAGVSYKLEGAGSRILVPQDSVYKVRADLAAAGVQGAVVPQGYELLDQQGLSVSDFKQRVDYQRALEGELARTLSAMDGVRSATVHLVIPQEALFSENQQPVTASVLIDPNGSMSQADVEAVVMIVSSSVEGLEPNQVTVASTDGTVLHAAGDDTVTALGNKQLRMTSDFETALSSDVASMLSSVLGAGRASVVVRAQLNFDERSTESETYSPDSATPLKQQNIDENFDGSGTPPAGSLGTNGVPVNSTTNGGYTYTRKEDTTEYGIDKVVVRTTNAPGTIERLSVAVVVDDGSLTGATTPDVSALQSLVAAAIGADTSRGDTVQVSSIPFPAIDAGTAADPEASATAGAMGLIPTVLGALVLVGATLGLFLMSRGGKKAKSRKGEIIGAPDALPMGGEVYDPQMIAQSQAMHGLTDDVSALVERQPEEIATLLRSWLADRREAV